MHAAFPLLTEKTARRFAEMNAALDIAAPGVAENYLDGILSQIIERTFDVVLEGWEFDEGEAWARAQLSELATKWEVEDAL